MATIKERVYRKNASGTYDVIHHETESSIVMRPNGHSVEQDLAAQLPVTQNNDNVPESLQKLIIGKTKSWIRGKELSVAGHKHDISDITNITSLPSTSIIPFNIKWNKLKTFSVRKTRYFNTEYHRVSVADYTYDFLALSLDSITGSMYNNQGGATLTISPFGANNRSIERTIEIIAANDEVIDFGTIDSVLPFYDIYVASGIEYNQSGVSRSYSPYTATLDSNYAGSEISLIFKINAQDLIYTDISFKLDCSLYGGKCMPLV